MLRYILFRLLQVIPVLLGTTFLIYFMVFAMPGDPIVAMFGDKTPNPVVLEKLREQYNLDQPFIDRRDDTEQISDDVRCLTSAQ